MMRVLVTGGAGWIGQATCRALNEAGHEPVVLDRHTGSDVRDRAGIQVAVDEVDHVIHLAGVLGTHELFGNAVHAVEVNVLGSLMVTLACGQADVGLTEITMPRVNPSLYAATKACAMDIAEAYRHAWKLRVSYVRAYNAYGTGQAYGGEHPQKIIPTFATKAWLGEPLPIWGNGDLLCDLVHVDDVARMLVEAMAFGDGQVFDAGTGYGQDVNQIASRVIHITKSISDIERLEPRPGEREHSTDGDVACGAGWHLLDGWRPVFDARRFEEAVMSYRP
jgi:UDP-glucose 4-epimerase